ncbi:MAG TPA: hypothetical protein H9762_06200 [Candidatus Ligilactobacillus avistercoris]|nr:hypothetical protein [Candidatus Ligilactobacillus avistercoris]
MELRKLPEKNSKQWVIAGITTAVATIGTVSVGNHHVKADALAAATTQSTPTQVAQSSRAVVLRSTSTTTSNSSSTVTTFNRRENTQSSEVSFQSSKDGGAQDQIKNPTSQTNITAAQEAANQQILDNGKNTFRENQTANIYNMHSFSVGLVPNRSLGVDVSSYQGTNMTPYAQVGATFSIVKVSQGTGYVNPNAAGQIRSSESNGMMTQGYHYATFGGNAGAANAEAAHAITAAQQVGLPKGTYLACDYEQYASGDVNANTNAVIEFMQRIKDAGYIPLLYSGAYYMKTHLNLSAIINRFGNCLWIASYPTMSAVDGPNFNYFPSTDGVIMWQYTDNWKGMNVDSSVNVLPMQVNTNTATTNGQVFSNGHWHYYENGHLIRNQYIHINNQNKTCYYDGNGNMVYGQQNINGHWQYFDPTTGAQARGTYVYISSQGKTCYYDGNGNMVYGQHYINGHWQYFDTYTGAQARSKYIVLASLNKTVYYDGNGNMVYGQHYINGHWQYFDTYTGAQARSKYVILKDLDKTVYYDADGNMVYGQKYIDGHWQYFDPETGAQVKKQYVTITGLNKTCYYDVNGNMVYGQEYINGHWQYFDPVTGALARNRYVTITGLNKICYYNSRGNMVYGWQEINGRRQYFDTYTGAQLRNCTTVIDGQSYTFNSNGGVISSSEAPVND